MFHNEHPRHLNSLELHEMSFPSKLGESLSTPKTTEYTVKPKTYTSCEFKLQSTNLSF